ncbi:MAG: bifunctional hydroxymethylpyrimidine kinase/phosphomethylpyrimidine kinase [Lachnospiraceae bacterium]|nr:bifunctional hydroxymethylpyrimidine kinase/phosphomethylpyrimidine kinase [Lachnospiraceae bacterium]
MKKVLTIAGSDSSGGAGIQADIKTMMAHGVYASSVITAITAQNTLGVKSIQEVGPDVFRDEVMAVYEDICPDAVKIGMIASMEQIEILAELLRKYEASNIVIDPVMIATSGAKLLPEDCIEILWEKLLCCADLITPNIPEAIYLLEKIGIAPSDMNLHELNSQSDYVEMARLIFDNIRGSVLLKGGHRSADKGTDILVTSEGVMVLQGEIIDSANNHGTGCTLSSAIASNLAKGMDMSNSVRLAKQYVEEALRAGLDIGQGNGPLNHGFDLHGKYID